MAVVNVKKMWSVNNGQRDSSSRSITEGYTVLFDTPANASTYKAGTAAGIPVRGESHSEDTYLRAKARTVKALSPFLYQVEWTYQLPANTGEHTDGQDPLDQPVKYRRSTMTSQEVVTRAADGTLVATTNGEEFDPPVMDDVYDTVVTLTKNFATFNEATAKAYTGAINSDTFLGNPAGTCKIVAITAENVVDGDLIYWPVTVEIAIREPKVPGETAAQVWQKRVLNQGYRVRATAGDPASAAVHFREPDGTLTSKPVLIKSDGTRETNPAAAHWRYFDSPFTKKLPFATLNLV